MRLRRLLRELPATFAALGLAVVVEVGLRTGPLPALARRLGVPLAGRDGAGASAPGDAALSQRDRRQVRATRRVMRRWPFGDTCLRQALVSGHLLRHLDPALHVGVAKIDGEIRAHAWLVIDGGILDPLAAASSYLDLARPDEVGAR